MHPSFPTRRSSYLYHLDHRGDVVIGQRGRGVRELELEQGDLSVRGHQHARHWGPVHHERLIRGRLLVRPGLGIDRCILSRSRSEEHTSELQSLMRISYASFSLEKKKNISKY